MLLKKCTLHLRTGPADVYADCLKSWLFLGFLLWEGMSFRESVISLESLCWGSAGGGFVAKGEHQRHAPHSHLFPMASPILRSKTKLNRAWPSLASLPSQLSGSATKTQIRPEYYLSKTVPGSSLLPHLGTSMPAAHSSGTQAAARWIGCKYIYV